MDVVEHEKLIETIDNLIRNSNGWESVDKFIKENKELQPFYKKVQRECIDSQCYGVATIYKCLINELLEHLDEDYAEYVKKEWCE